MNEYVHNIAPTITNLQLNEFSMVSLETWVIGKPSMQGTSYGLQDVTLCHRASQVLSSLHFILKSIKFVMKILRLKSLS